MLVKKFDLVRLYLNKYDEVQLEDCMRRYEEYKCPMVLVIRTYEDNNSALVRYPNGYIERVQQDSIKPRLIPTTHPQYLSYAMKSGACRREYRKNEEYKDLLDNLGLPQDYWMTNKTLTHRMQMPTCSNLSRQENMFTDTAEEIEERLNQTELQEPIQPVNTQSPLNKIIELSKAISELDETYNRKRSELVSQLNELVGGNR